MNEEIGRLTERLEKIRQEIENSGSTDLPRYLAASDIHGNVARLREILSTAKEEGISQIFLVGDIYSEGKLPLPADLNAASFAKLSSREPCDLAHALCGLVGENISLICGQLARERTQESASAASCLPQRGSYDREHVRLYD